MTHAGTETAANASDGESGAGQPLSTGRKIVYSVVVLVLLAGGAEIVGQILYAGRTSAQRYLAEAYYRERPWAEAFLKAQDALTLRYEPYVGWRRIDYRSENLNIVGGERVTVHPHPPTDSAVTIWCFGGSTMWGEGVRDGYTIPSHLARIAQGAGFDVRVRNLGESGWVSTQEAIFCALKLRRGERPDIALFYDGVNDVFSAYQSGLTDGGPQNRDIFENYFNRGYDPRRRFRNKIALYRAARRISMAFSGAFEPSVGGGVDADETAEATVRTYGQTVDLARRVGVSYGVETLFFWQPVIAFQPEFKHTEHDAYRRGSSPSLDGMLDFYVSATRFVPSDVIDLSRCLGPSPGQGYYVDHNHLNEEGNAVVAEAIFAHIRPLIEKRRAKHGGGTKEDGVAGGGL